MCGRISPPWTNRSLTPGKRASRFSMISPTVAPDTTTLSAPSVRFCNRDGIHTTDTVPTLWPALPSSLAPETWGCGADARQWPDKWRWQWRLLVAQWVLPLHHARRTDALDWALPP